MISSGSEYSCVYNDQSSSRISSSNTNQGHQAMSTAWGEHNGHQYGSQSQDAGTDQTRRYQFDYDGSSFAHVQHHAVTDTQKGASMDGRPPYARSMMQEVGVSDSEMGEGIKSEFEDGDEEEDMGDRQSDVSSRSSVSRTKSKKRPRQTSSSLPSPIPRRDKPKGELLSKEERKANHIACEKKRREAIRNEYSKIVELVPGLDMTHSRSEALVLEKTVDYLHLVLSENRALQALAEAHAIPVPSNKNTRQQR